MAGEASSVLFAIALKGDVNMDNRHKVCIDRILPRDLMRLQENQRGRESLFDRQEEYEEVSRRAGELSSGKLISGK